MSIIKNICFFLVLGVVLNGISFCLESNYLNTFLHNQIITLCITLVAITSAVRGIVLGKLIDLSVASKELDFRATFKEIRISVYEQVIMIILSILLLILYSSKKISCQALPFIIDSLLSSILLYSIYILFDMAKATIDIFIAIDENNKAKNDT